MSLTKVTYSMIQGAPINIVDYGADSANTATQNDAAIALAIAALGTNDELVIPQGVFNCTICSFANLDNFSVNLIGKLVNQATKPAGTNVDARTTEGGVSPTLKFDTCTKFSVYGPGVIENGYREAIYLTNCSNFTVNANCIGTSVNDNLTGIYVRYCTDFSFAGGCANAITKKLTSGYNNWSNAFQIWDSYRFAVEGMAIENNGMNGVYVALNCHDFRITGNNIYSNGASGVQIAWTGDTAAEKYPYRFTIDGNIITYNRADSIDCNNTHPSGIQDAFAIITDNQCAYNGWVGSDPTGGTPTPDGAGVTLVNLYNVIVSNNSVYENSRTGVYVNTCQDVVVDGNFIYKSITGSTGDGIYTEAVARAKIVNNRVYWPGNQAIKLFGAMVDTTFDSNLITGRWVNPTPSGSVSYTRVSAARNSIATDNIVAAYYDFVENGITSTYDGAILDVGSNINVVRNKIYSTIASASVTGINSSATSNAVIEENYVVCSGAGAAGIKLTSAAQPKVVNNYSESKGKCISIDTCTQPVLTGNRANNTGSDNSFYVTGSTNGIKFANAAVAGSTSFGSAGQYDINY